MQSKIKGIRGEAMAKKVLESKGYEILEQNYQKNHREIDLIALKDNELLVFVEVKRRKNSTFGHPEEFVNAQQQQRILALAEDYVLAIQWKRDIRFDVIAIDDEDGEIHHFEDAFC